MAFSFKPDGSLDAKPRKKRDHLPLLAAIQDVPFGMGKKLLIKHLRGERNAKTARLRLDRYQSHGELGGYEEEEIARLMTHLERAGLITREQGRYPVYALTASGEQELQESTRAIDIDTIQDQAAQALEIDNPFTQTTTITDKDQELFAALNDFLEDFNDEQKKAVTSPEAKVLCVAGPGTGKTSVLTKRIAFLVRYRSVPPERILAITFTRKARKEMEERLAEQLPGTAITIETFNSLSEKTLLRHGQKIYEEHVSMASFKEQTQLLIDILKKHGYTQASIIDHYFTKRQRQGKDHKTLFFSFAYDFQSLLDKLRLTNQTIEQLRNSISAGQEHAPLARALLTMAEDYLQGLKAIGKRDYTDQVLDTITLFERHQEAIPRYDHVLVDEYQDVNDQQILLLEHLKPQNLFCVGDPRQSIYGWRGSKLGHIIDFPKRHERATIIQLTKNYRSGKAILELCNDVIKKTGYPDLEAATAERGSITIKRYANEDEQAGAVTKAIKEHRGDRKEIFILARTNKALDKMQRALEAHGIDYLLRTDELKRPSIDPRNGQVTIATIHAIKGLEAEHVHLIGANNNSFPCKASDHPVMDLFNLQESYDNHAEELRVLYVALSRAKKALHINYTGTITPFLEHHKPKAAKQQKLAKTGDQESMLMELRRWRYQQAKERGVPAYVICTDKTLEALIENKPHTVEELETIPGLSSHRIEEFGEALLARLSSL